MFVSFEGVDWSGKSTQAELLVDWLRGEGRTVLATREPGGTPLAEAVREVVLHGHDMTPWAEAALYAAARADHVEHAIRPALERGEDVVCDRYLDSSVAYQGAGRVLDPDEVRGISLWATEDFMPDLTILLDLDETIGRERLNVARTKYDRLEAEEGDFHARVRAGFLRLAGAEPDRFLVLSATDPIDSIAAAVRARVEPLLVSR